MSIYYGHNILVAKDRTCMISLSYRSYWAFVFPSFSTGGEGVSFLARGTRQIRHCARARATARAGRAGERI